MELLQTLQHTKTETLSYYSLSASDLAKTYANGKWTIRQLLVHLSDAEGVLLDRIRRIIAEPKQVIWAFDQDCWNNVLDYTNYPLGLNKAVFEANRNTVLHLVEMFYESHGSNPFIHSETGLRTLKDEMEKIAWHNEHHLKQIRIALERERE